jgi:hypothetical protein
VGEFRDTTQGFPKPKDPINLVGDEVDHEKWNGNVKNTLI